VESPGVFLRHETRREGYVKVSKFLSWQDSSRSDWGNAEYSPGQALPFTIEHVGVGALQRIAKSLEQSNTHLDSIADSLERFVYLMDPNAQLEEKKRQEKKDDQIIETQRVWELLSAPCEAAISKIPEFLPRALKCKIISGLRYQKKHFARWSYIENPEESVLYFQNFDVRDNEHLIRLDGIGKLTAKRILDAIKSGD